MVELGYHIMLRCDDDRVLAPSDQARRALARAVYRVAERFPLLSFGAADNHLHLVVLCDRARAAELAGRLKRSMRWTLGLRVDFFPVRIKRLADQHHLVSAFHYSLGQRNKHGVRSDPYLDASSLPELLGLRLLATGTIPLVREWIARLGRERLLLHLSLPTLEPASATTLGSLAHGGHGALLCDAACGALALPTLQGRGADVVRARNALIKLLAPHCSTIRIAKLTDRSPSQVRHLKSLPHQPHLEHAVSLQIAVRVGLLHQRTELTGAVTPFSI